MKLNSNNLEKITGIKKPNYDRSKLSPGIVHIGLGNFHRAHQAWYLHRLMQKGLAYDWAIIGAGVRAGDEEMRKRLTSQDYLTSLIELSPSGCEAEIIGSMIGFIPVETTNAALIKQMANPAIRIVSTTVTEGGYFIDPATKGFDSSNLDIQHDVANPEKPRTVFGAMVAALKIRYQNGHAPFTCQSCDNILGNGNIMRQTVVSLAKMSNPELAKWVNDYSSFPNSMVDSIVPATGPKELALAMDLGIDDLAPVTHENFRQWVIEDSFCAGRPPWEKAGATISDCVHGYETMKIRILNGGHQIIAATGDLLGIDTISETIRKQVIADFFNKVEHEEIMPHVSAVPEYTPESYVKLIEQRFRNNRIVDTTRRVAFDGSSRQPGFILPSVKDCLSKGILPNGLALVSAIWARYCVGIREDGSIIEANDPFWNELKSNAKLAKNNPKLWLNNSSIYGEMADEKLFAEPFVKWLNMIYNKGLEKTLYNYLEGTCT